MIPRRVLGTVALGFCLATSSLAQLTDQAKSEVLDAVNHVISTEAFVPGVDLARWPTYLRQHQTELDNAETNSEFAGVLNDAFREFGISHIMISRETGGGRRNRFSERFDDYLLQGIRRRAPQDSASWLDDNIGFIRINTFTEGYDSRFVEQSMDAFRDAKGIVVDLRGNPGGLLENMHHFLAMFLPSRTKVGTFVTRETAQDYTRATRLPASDPIKIAKWSPHKFIVQSSSGQPYDGKVAVLLDEGSASASEIIADALRESDHATIVGRPSAGAVLMSTFESLPHRFKMQFPISDYVSIQGRRLEGNPILPDVELSQPDTYSLTAVDTAAKKLEGR